MARESISVSSVRPFYEASKLRKNCKLYYDLDVFNEVVGSALRYKANVCTMCVLFPSQELMRGAYINFMQILRLLPASIHIEFPQTNVREVVTVNHVVITFISVDNERAARGHSFDLLLDFTE